jgi:hypothetical protein
MWTMKLQSKTAKESDFVERSFSHTYTITSLRNRMPVQLTVKRIPVKIRSHKLKRNCHGAVTLDRQADNEDSSSSLVQGLPWWADNYSSVQGIRGTCLWILNQNYADRITYHEFVLTVRIPRQGNSGSAAEGVFSSPLRPVRLSGPPNLPSIAYRGRSMNFISTCRYLQNIMQGRRILLSTVHICPSFPMRGQVSQLKTNTP